jgi:hypothetical protein
MPAYLPVWTRYREFGSKLGSRLREMALGYKESDKVVEAYMRGQGSNNAAR